MTLEQQKWRIAMKRSDLFLALILSVLLLLSGCNTEIPEESKPPETDAPITEAPDTTPPETEAAPITTFGGVPIAEITEIAYYGNQLKASASKLAQALQLLGAGEINIHEGTPADGGYAIELGCATTDPRLEGLGKYEAIVSADGKTIFGAVNGTKFGHEYAANIISSLLGEADYADAFTKRSILHDITVLEKDENPPLIDNTQDTSSVHFQGTTQYDALQYRCGDNMVFDISLKQNDQDVACTRFKYVVAGDDGKEISGTVDGSTGSIRLTTSLTVPGFVRVTITAIGERSQPLENALIYDGGAGADIRKIEQSMPEPTHYDKFWADQLAKLDEIGIEVLSMTEIPSGNDDFVAYDVSLNCLGPKNGKDMPSTFIMTMPKDAEPGSLDGYLYYYGYAVPHPATPSCTENGITLSVNSHGLVNYGMPDSYYDEYSDEIGSFGFDNGENMDPYKSYFAGMLLRDIQAARYLLTRPEYNGDGITFHVGSMGSMRSINVAAQIGSDNVKLLDIGYPWMADLGAASVGKMPGWAPSAIDGSGASVPGIRYFDPVNAAKRITAPVVMDCRLGDYICPPSGEVVLYKAFASTEKTLTFAQNSDHGYISPYDEIYTVQW